jgi:hypothetical protein
MLTPFATPTGLAVPPHTTPDRELWVAYTNEEPYVREDPNGEEPYELTFRDRTLIHPSPTAGIKKPTTAAPTATWWK